MLSTNPAEDDDNRWDERAVWIDNYRLRTGLPLRTNVSRHPHIVRPVQTLVARAGVEGGLGRNSPTSSTIPRPVRQPAQGLPRRKKRIPTEESSAEQRRIRILSLVERCRVLQRKAYPDEASAVPDNQVSVTSSIGLTSATAAATLPRRNQGRPAP